MQIGIADVTAVCYENLSLTEPAMRKAIQKDSETFSRYLAASKLFIKMKAVIIIVNMTNIIGSICGKNMQKYM